MDINDRNIWILLIINYLKVRTGFRKVLLILIAKGKLKLSFFRPVYRKLQIINDL